MTLGTRSPSSTAARPSWARHLALTLLVILPGFIAGCGGGGGGSTSTTTSSTTILAPNTLVGAVIVMNYSDGRSFTFTINNGLAAGVTRSDGKTSTNWTGAGYATPVLTLDVAYGAFTQGSLNNVFDDYGLNFVTKTTGSISLRENTTSNTYASSPVIGGTFTFTTYPPGG